ncbi:MAG: hypothetical protein ACR2QV_05495 [Gammaproteobacteria bacterium]
MKPAEQIKNASDTDTGTDDLYTRDDTMHETREKKDAFMEAWLQYKDMTDRQDREFAAQQAEIGRAVADVIADKLGRDDDLISGRDEEFGRVLSNVVRTFQTLVPYHHQGNDGLIKETLKWYEFASREGIVDAVIEHEAESMANILGERGGWAARTGRLELALDAITTPTCFRDLVLGEGFHLTDRVLSYKSPFGRVIEMGHKRGIWRNLTEERIHNIWTIPRYHAFAEILGVNFAVSPWDEQTKMITVTVSAK